MECTRCHRDKVEMWDTTPGEEVCKDCANDEFEQMEGKAETANRENLLNFDLVNGEDYKKVMKEGYEKSNKENAEVAKDMEPLMEELENSIENNTKTQSPLWLLVNILNQPELSKKYILDDAHALRNTLIFELKKIYNDVENVKRENMLLCVSPKMNVTKYDILFVRCLGKPYPAQIRDFQLVSNELMANQPQRKDDTRTPLQRFNRILIARDMSHSCKTLCFRFHIDFIQYKGNKWAGAYTGYKQQKGDENSKTDN
jgi:hypothetical protein